MPAFSGQNKYQTTGMGNLKKHIEHEGIKHSWNYCEQQFTRQEGLKIHMQYAVTTWRYKVFLWILWLSNYNRISSGLL